MAKIIGTLPDTEGQDTLSLSTDGSTVTWSGVSSGTTGGSIAKHRSGNSGLNIYYVAGSASTYPPTGVNFSPNTLLAFPLFCPQWASEIVEVGIYVTGIGAGSGQARVGIYRDNNTIAPGVLAADSGVIDTGSTGSKLVSVSVECLANEMIWLALVNSITQGFSSFVADSNSWLTRGYAGTDVTSKATTGVSRAFTFGALPDPFNFTSAFTSQSAPAIWARFA